MRLYSKDFYKDQQDGSRRSAQVIIPLILELIRPKCVIDIGCGVGTWLSIFKEHGVEDIWGVDGDYVDKKMLQIPEGCFLPHSLESPFRLDRQFDLVVSLEVAEHLPKPCAREFIDSLTRLGPIILFSAAIPLQGGKHHLNEQWPDYWANHFQERGYVAIDCIRDKIWQDDNVEFWYAQNILIFARKSFLEHSPLLERELERTKTSRLSIVHPKQYLELSERVPIRKAFSLLPKITKNALKSRLTMFSLTKSDK